MQRSLKITCLLATGLALGPLPATASVDVPPGSLFASFTPDELTRWTNTVDFAPFSVYILASELPEISAWESGLSLPADIVILSTSYSTPGALDIGGEPGNYIVGLGECSSADIGAPLLTIEMGFFTPGASAGQHDICVGASEPSSVGGAGPAFVDCQDNLYGFAFLPPDPCIPDGDEGCSVVNPPVEVIATEASSIGEFKARSAP